MVLIIPFLMKIICHGGKSSQKFIELDGENLIHSGSDDFDFRFGSSIIFLKNIIYEER